MAGFDDVELVLLDLDGTVYEGSRQVPGAAATVGRLRRAGLGVRFVTNTDSVTPGTLVERLAGMGIEAAAGEVLTPVALAARLFAARPDARVLAVAAPAVRDLLGPCLAGRGERPTHVLVCDPSFGAGYDDLDGAFRAVRAGAELVATQTARIARRDDGEHLDTGGFVRLLEYAAGVDARVLGKPSPEFFRLALDQAGEGDRAGPDGAVAPERALMVGDDLGSDVGGARAAGLRAVLVRTGKGAEREEPAQQPDAVLDSVADLPALLGVG